MLISSIQKNFNELIALLLQMSHSDYVKSYPQLSNATIGEHTRHIIEMFQCLESQYESGNVDYDKRNRDYKIQTDTRFAIKCMNELEIQLDKPNKKLNLIQMIDGQQVNIESNFTRELLYNLEHCVHHQALIKVVVMQNETFKIDENFGVARSTIEYRKQCAQ